VEKHEIQTVRNPLIGSLIEARFWQIVIPREAALIAASVAGNALSKLTISDLLVPLDRIPRSHCLSDK